MDDLISRQAAIDALAKFVPYAICDESTESYTNGLTDAYYLILQLPSVQPDHVADISKKVDGDCISRQAALKELAVYIHLIDKTMGKGTLTDDDCMEAAKSVLGEDEVPAVQPEIIRCKDCKHWDGVDACDVIDVPVWDNDFCSMAERRSNE